MKTDAERIEHAHATFQQAMGLLEGAYRSSFPPGGLPNPHGFTLLGTSSDEPLRSVASRIYEVMECFGDLQIALGLPPGEEPRFAEFFRGTANKPRP